MRSQRYPCARAGTLVLAAAFALALPTVVQARSSFNSGVVNAADQIINLMANGNESRSDMRHLRQALNQLLDVIGQQHLHGHMGKGMHHHHHHHHHAMNHSQAGGNVGSSAGKKNTVAAPAAKGLTSGKNKVGNSPGKRSGAKSGNQDFCNVKHGAGPQNTSATVNRKSGNAQLAGNAKTGATPRTNRGVGTQVGANKKQQGAKTNLAFGNAKTGHAHTGGSAVANALATGAVRQIATGKGATKGPTPTHNVAKANAKAPAKIATPVVSKKANGPSNPAAFLAVQQHRSPHHPFASQGHANAGASVGHRAVAHASPIRRR